MLGKEDGSGAGYRGRFWRSANRIVLAFSLRVWQIGRFWRFPSECGKEAGSGVLPQSEAGRAVLAFSLSVAWGAVLAFSLGVWQRGRFWRSPTECGWESGSAVLPQSVAKRGVLAFSLRVWLG